MVIVFSIASCSEDFLDPQVTINKDVNTSINTEEDLNGIVLGAYDRMNASSYLGRDYIGYAEVRSDNALSNGKSGRFVGPAQFFLNPTDGYPTSTWSQLYEIIANANIVINTVIENNDSRRAQHLKGEALAIRALAHMDLLRLFGQQNSGGNLGIPYITTYNGGDLFPARLTISEVWQKIGEDLDLAETKMSADEDILAPVRFTTLGLAALKTRYYLYMEDYDNVIKYAEIIINAGEHALATGDAYLNIWGEASATTSLFELGFTATDNLSSNSLAYIYQATNYGDIEATMDLYNTYEDGDVRKQLYTVSSPRVRMYGKYPKLSSNIRVIRFAEVILNYAEALTLTGSADALDMLNMIPTARHATPYTEATLDNVLLERRKELAMEGHRFFDLMRHGLSIKKVDSRQTFDGDEIPFGSSLLPFPIPQAELNANPNMTQNVGY